MNFKMWQGATGTYLNTCETTLAKFIGTWVVLVILVVYYFSQQFFHFSTIEDDQLTQKRGQKQTNLTN